MAGGDVLSFIVLWPDVLLYLQHLLCEEVKGKAYAIGQTLKVRQVINI